MPAPPPDSSLARRRRTIAIVTLSTIVAALAAVASVCSVTLAPPSVEVHSRDGIAVTHAVLQLHQAPPSGISDALETEIKRGNLIANVMATPPVLRRVARLGDIGSDQIEAEARANENVPAAL
jgi:hypothetical protein